jgi:two-component system, cell cycle sensor histidine kinase and response regulator CckA
MPEMDGRSAYRALRAIDPAVKTLLISGYSLDGQAQGALDEGVLGFLPKPFSAEELAAAVSRALGR